MIKHSISIAIICLSIALLPIWNDARADGFKQSVTYRDVDGDAMVHTITFCYGDAVWYITEEISDPIDGLVYFYELIAWGSVDNPNPDDPSSGTGPDIVQNIEDAIKKGDIMIYPKETPVSSELFDVLGRDGSSVPDNIWNPYDEGRGGVGPIVIVGSADIDKILNMIEDIKSGMPGDTGSILTDASGEYNPDAFSGTPTGSGGTGGGSGDGSGDGTTDSIANENGYISDFSSTDGLVIHPQANPAP